MNPAKKAIRQLSISEIKELRMVKAIGETKIEAVTHAGVGYIVTYDSAVEASQVMREICAREKPVKKTRIKAL